jgi:Stigma-specific protein, Stig1
MPFVRPTHDDPCWCGTNNCGISGVIDCRDLTTDPENCGACGMICSANASCLDGACVSPAMEIEDADMEE